MDCVKMELSNICLKLANKNILQNVNLKIEKNKIYSFIGKSGSGKTSLLNIMNFLYKPTSGTIAYNNENIDCDDNEKIEKLRNQEIAYFQQELSFIEDISIWQNFMCFASIKGIELNESDIKKLADKLGIEKLLQENVSVLSGGERQRAAFLKLLFLPSQLVLIDEPTNNLDKENIDIILDSIRLLKEKGKTIIIVSHSEVITSISDHTYHMENLNEK